VEELTLDSTIDIGRGVRMPRLGFGTYKAMPGEVEHAVEFALTHGYRGIDTASAYGNEEGVARGIRASGVPREDLFLTTKVWNDEQGYGSTRQAFERSLRRLGMDYVDLYLVHWPNEEHMAGTWKAMEELLGEGKTRAIGVCNHLPEHLEALMKTAEVVPAVDQVEFHPLLQRPSLQTYLVEHDIVLEAWAPMMKGRIGEVAELVEIARAHGVSPAQVAIRWILQQGYVTIPKSVHDERIVQNADVFGFSLADEEMERLATLDQDQRLGPDPNTYAW
jgi:diketogulonate reductase-like aldo/keto reductase